MKNNEKVQPNNVILLMSPRVMELHHQYMNVQKLLNNVEILLEGKTQWVRMERETEFETPFYRLLCAAENRRLALIAEEKNLIGKMMPLVS